MSSSLARLSFSIEQSLADKLEKMVAESGYTNRSEYLRDMIRQQLVKRAAERNKEVVGTIMMVYDHHTRELNKKLTELQHSVHDMVLATTHVHLDHHLCAEVVIAKGQASAIERLADQLRQQKGVLFATFSVGTTGRELI